MIDLHTHSKASDGVLAPDQLVKLAKEIGLTGISITDHDTIGGIENAILAGQKYSMLIVPGIELSTLWGGSELHILGYFIDFRQELLQEKLRFIQKKRIERVEQIIAKAISLGISINFKELESIAQGDSIGRPHIGQLLIEKGYTRTLEDSFERYLNKDKPLYVERFKLTPAQGINLIIASGGVPVLAHPGLYDNRWQYLIEELKEKGLQGIEVYYPAHSINEIDMLNRLCGEYDLIATGGSDFHRIAEENNNFGKYGVCLKTIKKLEERKRND